MIRNLSSFIKKKDQEFEWAVGSHTLASLKGVYLKQQIKTLSDNLKGLLETWMGYKNQNPVIMVKPKIIPVTLPFPVKVRSPTRCISFHTYHKKEVILTEEDRLTSLTNRRRDTTVQEKFLNISVLNSW